MTRISVQNLSKVFGPAPEAALKLLNQGLDRKTVQQQTHCTVALHNISFDIEENEFVVIMGLSGSGKSTLVRCLNRIIEPTSGSILVDGVDITQLDTKKLRELRQRYFGMVFQDFALFPHRTVLRNVEFGLEVMGMEAEARRVKSMDALSRVGLSGWEQSYPRQMSGGMCQRVGLARALALDPQILLMDEAFSALDPLIRRDMQDELLTLQRGIQKTIVFITHDLDEALKLGERIVMLRDGCIVQTGTPEEILMAPADEYVARFVASADITQVLTAEHIMKRSEAVAVIGHDGPRAVLRAMRVHSITSLFVLNADRQFRGIVHADDAERLIAEKSRDLASIVHEDIITVTPDTPAAELLSVMSTLPYPLAVVDDKQHLRGVIVRGLLLGAIAEREVCHHEHS